MGFGSDERLILRNQFGMAPPPKSPVPVLNRLLALHHRSLPQYLCSATPWTTASDSQAIQVLREIAEDQRWIADQIGAMILSEAGRPNMGEYPMSFTGLHDLSLQHLVGEVTVRQRKEIESIQECVDQLSHAPAARAVAENALGAAKGQLQNLEELDQRRISVASL